MPPLSDRLQIASNSVPPGPPAHEATLARRIAELGDWFHNLDLHGVPTAPHHFLGDFPNIKWEHIGKALPQDLTGATVLDIGCNGGFYFIPKKQRGAGGGVGMYGGDRHLTQSRCRRPDSEHAIEL